MSIIITTTTCQSQPKTVSNGTKAKTSTCERLPRPIFKRPALERLRSLAPRQHPHPRAVARIFTTITAVIQRHGPSSRDDRRWEESVGVSSTTITTTATITITTVRWRRPIDLPRRTGIVIGHPKKRLTVFWGGCNRKTVSTVATRKSQRQLQRRNPLLDKRIRYVPQGRMPSQQQHPIIPLCHSQQRLPRRSCPRKAASDDAVNRPCKWLDDCKMPRLNHKS